MKANNTAPFLCQELQTCQYSFIIAINAILASIRASLVPKHDLGPHPNGM